MLIPYRVKNPPKRLPYLTVGIIALNAVVYLFTTDYLVVIRQDVLRD